MIGGQALIEGIMMLGPEKKAVVVRKPDGELVEQVEERVLIKDKHPILGVPFLRGVFNFCSSLANGVKALMYSASFFPEDEEPEEPSKFELWLDKRLGSEKAAGAVVTFAVVLGILFSVVLFFLLPTALAGGVAYFFPLPMWGRNLLEGVVRIVIFMGYLVLCSRMKDIHRVFEYHGAEHKTIHCYEHGLPLTPENARSFPRLHVRCGTAFLIMVMIIAIFVYTVVPLNALIAAWGVPDGAPKLALVILSRIVLMPVIAGVSYEITVRWAGSHPDNPLVKVVLWPGMQMQYLTTNEPDDGMLECAIAAMKLVLDREEAEAEQAARVEQATRATQAKQAAQTA